MSAQRVVPSGVVLDGVPKGNPGEVRFVFVDFFEGVELARTFASVPFLWFLVAEENLEVENN